MRQFKRELSMNFAPRASVGYDMVTIFVEHDVIAYLP